MTSDRARLRLWLEMLKSVRHVENDIRERFRTEFGTTLPRFDVLAMLDRTPAGLKMSELSRQLMVSNGNVTGIVERLSDEELVLRKAVEGDRRASLVQLTPKGKTALDEMAIAHRGWINDLLGDLPDTEVGSITRILAKVRKAQ